MACMGGSVFDFRLCLYGCFHSCYSMLAVLLLLIGSVIDTCLASCCQLPSIYAIGPGALITTSVKAGMTPPGPAAYPAAAQTCLC